MASNRALKKKMIADKDLLYRMYHQENLSLTDIGEKYGCSRQYVQLIFKELGIARRPRLQALKNRPRKRKSKYNFTEKDDKFILENCDDLTDPKLAEKLNKPVKSVIYRRLIVLGKKKVVRRNFTQQENKFILENYDHMTDNAIAEELNRSLISVTHHRNRILNCPKRDTKDRSEPTSRLNQDDFAEVVRNRLAEDSEQATVAIRPDDKLE